MWSGSEELWTRSAARFIDQGRQVCFASLYQHPKLDTVKAPHIFISQRFRSKSFFQKIIERFTSIRFNSVDVLRNFIEKVEPKLVLISQGNNIASLDIMQLCQGLGVPYITLTQLVTEVHFPLINSDNIEAYQKAYGDAEMNYFVSKHNLELNNLMLGKQLQNAEVVYNPCKLNEEDVSPFPSEKHGWNVGLVGRIECLHKGYDLLLQVLNSEKWKKRPIRFNFYGDGPHLKILIDFINSKNIQNVFMKGFVSGIKEVWSSNHILCLPSRMEGQALALIEAMFCRRAAIVTNVGGASELITDGYNGFISESASVQLLDDVLEKAWLNRSKWQEMGENARESFNIKYPVDAVAYFNNKLIGHLT